MERNGFNCIIDYKYFTLIPEFIELTNSLSNFYYEEETVSVIQMVVVAGKGDGLGELEELQGPQGPFVFVCKVIGHLE